MMDFQNCLMRQISRHPSMRPQDLVKLCYQGAYGAEHLLRDPMQAKDRLEREFAGTEAADTELYEIISPRICRVNLAAWKYRQLPAEWLFRMFAQSALARGDDSDVFAAYLETAGKLVEQGKTAFSLSDWKRYLEDYRAAGINPVHHSESYRKSESPSYRIIDCQFLRSLPLLEEIARRAKDGQVFVIAIDGRAASGKSTLAKLLKQVIHADIVQMDDFFLPPDLRTEARHLTPGGNVHYERFLEEVVPYIAKPQPFSYSVFDCSRMDFNGRKTIGNPQFRIVEGSYSCHPLFGRYADLTVFLQVEPAEQMRRILTRNGAEMAEVFRSKWIPLEEAYFQHDAIPEKADLRL